MKITVVPVLMFVAVTSVVAQGENYVDDIFARDLSDSEELEVRSDVHTQFQFILRELDEVRRRSGDFSNSVALQKERAERHRRFACDSGCNLHRVQRKKDACLKGCKTMFH